MDSLSTVYVGDSCNKPVICCPKGAQKGIVIVNEISVGAKVDQFNFPTGLSFDKKGNSYTLNRNNERAQRFSIMQTEILFSLYPFFLLFSLK